MPTIKVMQKRCAECLFSNARIVSQERMNELLATCKRTGRYFSCHKSTIIGEDYCCRGFYDQDSPLLALGKVRLVEFVTVSNGETHDAT